MPAIPIGSTVADIRQGLLHISGTLVYTAMLHSV